MAGFRKSDQEKWDESIESAKAKPWFGRGREAHRMADRMKLCPNNPRNGGEGYDRGDGRWTDRRWKAGG